MWMPGIICARTGTALFVDLFADDSPSPTPDAPSIERILLDGWESTNSDEPIFQRNLGMASAMPRFRFPKPRKTHAAKPRLADDKALISEGYGL
jgi:hypothetical protein